MRRVDRRGTFHTRGHSPRTHIPHLLTVHTRSWSTHTHSPHTVTFHTRSQSTHAHSPHAVTFHTHSQSTRGHSPHPLTVHTCSQSTRPPSTRTHRPHAPTVHTGSPRGPACPMGRLAGPHTVLPLEGARLGGREGDRAAPPPLCADPPSPPTRPPGGHDGVAVPCWHSLGTLGGPHYIRGRIRPVLALGTRSHHPGCRAVLTAGAFEPDGRRSVHRRWLTSHPPPAADPRARGHGCQALRFPKCLLPACGETLRVTWRRYGALTWHHTCPCHAGTFPPERRMAHRLLYSDASISAGLS